MDDFLGAKPMPSSMGMLGRPVMESERHNAPIRLEQDNDGRWVIMLNDGNRVIESVLPESVVDQIAARIKAEPVQATGLQAQVTVVANLGDCAAYVRKPLAYDPLETVQSLMERAHPDMGGKYTRHDPGDRVELQVIPETIPKAEDPLNPGDPWTVTPPF